VAKIKGRPEAGEIVMATTKEGQPLALGFYNPQSDIAFRMLTRDVATTVDQGFWQLRFRDAAALRNRIVTSDTTACRLVNAEGDGLPGLVVDRYGGYLVMAISTAGMEKNRETVIAVLTEECCPQGILERSDGPARRLEGLGDCTGWVWGEETRKGISIRENGLVFEVDILTGQKTGFFLDQRDNRLQIGSLCKGLSVLNCFSYTGAFSVYAARGGAKRVVSVDASEPANIAARRHLEGNGFSPEAHPVLREDVFQYLRKTEETFDLIILDPPAFAKGRREVQHAARGYKDINLQAFRRLAAGGMLATFSCSNAIDETLFEKIVLGAARDAGKTVRLLKKLSAAPDHPTGLAHSEGRYLKGLLLNALP
jgi:23S rRNA (cytosine1962-C5)-methyltransferase